MRVLLITNMYPSKQLPYSGVFVKAQYDRHKKIMESGEKMDIFFMRQVISGKIGSYLKYVLAYLRFIPKLFVKYDVIHVHFFGMLAPAASLYQLFHPRVKMIVTMHGGDINDDLPATGKKNAYFRKLVRLFDKIIPVGEALHEPIRQKLGIDPHFTMCAGVDKDVFYPEEVTKKYDFIVVGSFLPVKGLDILIDAIRKVNNPDLRWCFVGNGPLENEVRALQKDYQVDILGNKTQDELRKLYSESKYLMFTSRGDAFGLVVTEAIYCGTPAVVCADGGAQSQITDGVNGFVYANNDANTVAEMITKCSTISAAEYDGLSSRTPHTNYQYSLQNVCDTLLKFYRQLTAASRAESKTSGGWRFEPS